MVTPSPTCKQCGKVADASLHQQGHVDNCPDDYHVHHAYVPPEQAEFDITERRDER
jgi:hypothetical protein|tara:strand:- start:2181 stop:2348 length:168 start_codon:yes stop_codon:yes gene_type:complete